jgi:hypothetical protein
METTETIDTQQEIGIAGRILRIFYAPGETFAAVARKQSTADWVVPAVLSAAVMVICLVLASPVMTEFRQQAIEKQMQDMPIEQREVLKSSQGMMETGTLIATPIMTFVMLFITTGVYLVMGKLLGATLNYGQMLAINAYAMLIAIPQQVVKTPLMLAKETPMVQMGLGLVLSEEMLQTFSGRLLAAIDPFAIWSVLIIGLGLSVVGQVDRNKAYIGAALVSLVWLSIAVSIGGFTNPAK